jgi:N-acetylmuramoyl-L-alanine amidase
MPSVLVETGFITSPTEEQYLNSKEGQDYLASAIYRACRDYLSEIESRSGISVERYQDSVKKSESLTDSPGTSDEIIFMVQIKTSSTKTEIKPENFKGLSDIIEISTSDRFKYATGKFADYPEAAGYRKKIETMYPDAFVIAVKDNKILPLQQALEFLKKK